MSVQLIVVNVYHHFVHDADGDIVTDWTRVIDQTNRNNLRALARFSREDGYLASDVKKYSVEVQEHEMTLTIRQFFEKHPEYLQQMNLQLEDIRGFMRETTDINYGIVYIESAHFNSMYVVREVSEVTLLLKYPIVWVCKR